MSTLNYNCFAGFCVYHIKEPENTEFPLQKEYFETNRICAKSPVFSNSREVTGRFKLEPGTYIVIPSTYEPNHEGDYLLRIYAEKMTPLVLVS